MSLSLPSSKDNKRMRCLSDISELLLLRGIRDPEKKDEWISPDIVVSSAVPEMSVNLLSSSVYQYLVKVPGQSEMSVNLLSTSVYQYLVKVPGQSEMSVNLLSSSVYRTFL